MNTGKVLFAQPMERQAFRAMAFEHLTLRENLHDIGCAWLRIDSLSLYVSARVEARLRFSCREEDLRHADSQIICRDGRP